MFRSAVHERYSKLMAENLNLIIDIQIAQDCTLISFLGSKECVGLRRSITTFKKIYPVRYSSYAFRNIQIANAAQMLSGTTVELS